MILTLNQFILYSYSIQGKLTRYNKQTPPTSRSCGSIRIKDVIEIYFEVSEQYNYSP